MKKLIAICLIFLLSGCSRPVYKVVRTPFSWASVRIKKSKVDTIYQVPMQQVEVEGFMFD